MRAVYSKGMIFLGLALVGFLPAVLVAYTANQNLSLASEISISFAYVGMLFSIAYLGQRPYLAINATEHEGIAIHAVFRFINIAIITAILIIFSFIIDLKFYILSVVITIKFSEAVLDLSAGYTTKTLGINKSAKEFLLYAALRAACICLIFYCIPVITPENFLINVFFSLALFIFLFIKLIPLGSFIQEVRSYNFALYKRQGVMVLGFGLSTIACAILTASPRLLLVGENNIDAIAVALSAASVSALIFQAIWLSNINRLSLRDYKSYFIFFMEVLLITLAIYMSSPVWKAMLPYVYGNEIIISIDIFVSVILTTMMFFGAMSLVNLFKFEAPFLESVVYALAIIIYIISYLFFHSSVSESLIYAAILMTSSFFCLLIFKFISAKEKNTMMVFLRTSARPIPRVYRMMTVAKSLGLPVLFIGAHRAKDLPNTDTWEGFNVERVGSNYPMLNGKGLFQYLSGVISFNFAAFMKLMTLKPNIVHASDIETFPASFLYKLVTFGRVKLVYNIHDNLAQRYDIPTVFCKFLNLLEGIAVKLSNITLVPEDFRSDALPNFCKNKIETIRNTPIDPGYSTPPIIDNSTPIKIVFAGWMDEGRGIGILERLCHSHGNIELLLAGEGDAKVIERLQSLPNVKYFGFLDHSGVLELTKQAHYVFGFYSPHRKINIYAAPNKLAEALAIGRPVLINSETMISREIANNQCGLVVPYNDIDMLLGQINTHSNSLNMYDDSCKRARLLYETDYSWTVVKSKTEEIILKLMNINKGAKYGLR